MKIFTDTKHIIFQCDFCADTAEVKSGLNKRAFMRHLNKFARQHDLLCESIFRQRESRKQYDAAGQKASDIIKTLIESVK